MSGPSVVVVEDNRLNLASLRRIVRRLGFTPCLSSSYDEARAQIESMRGSPAGALIDVCLDCGRSGFDLVSLLRCRFGQLVPVMLFTGYWAQESEFRHRALELNIELLDKPVSIKQMSDFLVRAALSSLDLQPPLYRAVVDLAVHFALLPQEVRIVGQLSAGCSRINLPSRLGLSTDTVKWQIKRLLAKTGTKSTSELLALVLRTAGTNGGKLRD